MTSMEEYGNIDAMVQDAEETLERLKTIQRRIRKERQASCPHAEYSAEHNGDCHSSGYYYTCVHCKRWTNIRPQGASIRFE